MEETFGERLKKAREAKKYSQEKLGKEIGVARTQITNYEKGTSAPSYEKLKLICTTLDVSSDWLLGIPDTKAKDEENKAI